MPLLTPKLDIYIDRPIQYYRRPNYESPVEDSRRNSYTRADQSRTQTGLMPLESNHVTYVLKRKLDSHKRGKNRHI